MTKPASTGASGSSQHHQHQIMSSSTRLRLTAIHRRSMDDGQALLRAGSMPHQALEHTSRDFPWLRILRCGVRTSHFAPVLSTQMLPLLSPSIVLPMWATLLLYSTPPAAAATHAFATTHLCSSRDATRACALTAMALIVHPREDYDAVHPIRHSTKLGKMLSQGTDHCSPRMNIDRLYSPLSSASAGHLNLWN